MAPKQRTTALETELAGDEQVTEYVSHMCRAELTWVREVNADIDSHELSRHRDTYGPSSTKEYAS